MIPARNQEVLSMMVDDFWVDEDLLGIRISTYKETANHKPVHQIHYRFAETYPERLLLRGLREQKDYALECQQTIIQPSLKNRLMVSNNNPSKLVDSEEFNSYLTEIEELVKQLEIERGNNFLKQKREFAQRRI